MVTRSRSRASSFTWYRISGAISIPPKPNYNFERREREKSKAAEAVKKARAKADKRAAAQEAPATDDADGG